MQTLQTFILIDAWLRVVAILQICYFRRILVFSDAFELTIVSHGHLIEKLGWAVALLLCFVITSGDFHEIGLIWSTLPSLEFLKNDSWLDFHIVDGWQGACLFDALVCTLWCCAAARCFCANPIEIESINLFKAVYIHICCGSLEF